MKRIAWLSLLLGVALFTFGCGSGKPKGGGPVPSDRVGPGTTDQPGTGDASPETPDAVMEEEQAPEEKPAEETPEAKPVEETPAPKPAEKPAEETPAPKPAEKPAEKP